MPAKPVYEMTGQRFGRRVVIGRCGKATNGDPNWLCQCDCGKIEPVKGFDLRNGRALQCRECAVKNRTPGRGMTVHNLLHNARARAKKYNIPCNITLSDIQIPEKCPLLGIPIMAGEGVPTDNSPSLDRIIPELGYVRENIMVISYRANTIKQNSTPDELEKLAKNLRKEMKKRNLL